jgi:hypothetical protein
MEVPDAGPEFRLRGRRMVRILGHTLGRARTARFPFRVGQVLVGDDPFNGHQLGTVAVVTPPVVGLRAPGQPAGHLFFYDYRHLKEPE